MGLKVDALMATLDDAANSHAFIVLGAYGFRLNCIRGLDMRRETLIRISP